MSPVESGSPERAGDCGARAANANGNPDDALRAAVLGTARSVQALQRQNEQALRDAKAALERQTEELARSLALLNATLQATPDAVIAIDMHGRIVTWNERFAALCGMSGAQMAAVDGTDWVVRMAAHFVDPDAYLACAAELRRDPDRPSMSVHELHDGRIFERHATPHRVDGRCVGAVIHWRDVTERRRSELALRRSAVELRIAQRVAQVGSWQMEIPSGRVHWSDEMFRIFGREPELGAVDYGASGSVLAPQSRQLLAQCVERAVATGDGWGVELEIVRPDGEPGWINARAEAERDADGKVVLLRGSAHDVTESRRAQLALRESQQRLQALFDNALNAILLIDDAGRFVEANPAACTMLGYERADLIGRPMQQVIADPAEAAMVGAAWLDVLRSGRRSGTLNLGRKDGTTLVAEFSAVAQVLAGVNLAMLSDVTEKKRAQQMRIAKEAAEAANRSKSAFVSRMSHELRTPLNAILGFSEAMQIDRAAPLHGEQRLRVGHIRSAGMHLLALIEDILDVSRLESGSMRLQLESIDAVALVEEAVRSVGVQAEARRIAMRVDSADGPTRVSADRVRLKQVMFNLLSNAIKYNRPGGTVVVGLEAAGSRLRISVADDGLGMTAAQLARLFEPFNRLGRESSGVEGNGIGLVISRNLVELMGGELTVQSEPAAGSVFCVDLALAAGRASAATLPAPLTAAGELAEIAGSVLYIDDDEVNRLLMQALLAGHPGLRLELAADGSAGIDAALARPFDVILIDMRLTDMTGFDVLAAIDRAGGGERPPCVAVTADAMPEQIAAAAAAGFDAYLTKPISHATLLAQLARLISRG